eukprot:6463871-Amphidinium_carterae.1
MQTLRKFSSRVLENSWGSRRTAAAPDGHQSATATETTPATEHMQQNQRMLKHTLAALAGAQRATNEIQTKAAQQRQQQGQEVSEGSTSSSASSSTRSY